MRVWECSIHYNPSPIPMRSQGHSQRTLVSSDILEEKDILISFVIPRKCRERKGSRRSRINIRFRYFTPVYFIAFDTGVLNTFKY